MQFGDIYRLLSPYDEKGAASLMYVAPEKDKAVFYWWKTRAFRNEILPRITMKGLDPEKEYVVHELNRIDTKPLSFEGKSFSGKFLMENGLDNIRFFLGYSGWSRGQLTSEILKNTWALNPNPGHTDVLTGAEDLYWRREVRRLGEKYRSWLLVPSNPAFN